MSSTCETVATAAYSFVDAVVPLAAIGAVRALTSAVRSPTPIRFHGE